MAQPLQCDFCLRPRETRPQFELYYLVEISGPYLPQFDEKDTTKRSKNKKNLWGCRDCVNMIADTEYWMKYDEATGNKPYHLLEHDQSKFRVLALGVNRLNPGVNKNPTAAAQMYPPVPFHPPKRKRVG